MLPANSTGTPQDHALASGVVLQEAQTQDPTQEPAQPAQPAHSTPGPGPSRTTEARRKLSSTHSSASASGTTMGTSMTGTSISIVLGAERNKQALAPDPIGGEDTNIVFPTPPPPAQVEGPSGAGETKFDPPPCARGSTFCTDIDNYPENYLQSMLRSALVPYKEYFGKDEIPIGNISQRIDSNEGTPLCPYQEQVVYPKVAKNKEDKWRYIVNQDNYVQGVRVEYCSDDTKSCELADNFPYGYKTTCRQKYIFRKLVALHPEGNTQTDMFKLPSCCSCYFSITGSNVSSRRSNMTPVKKTGSRKR
ncbi:Protein spaetzle [Frankliniella fusca]|uniref:Protein spaetzle n=1 Tax=Frankliniella fusca TaxID=407009 RepID=A0AAE1LCZ4_9NEOP|nr:Protein spaetzle [Frankliniella fusca]